ncbi:MAG TPA: ferrochelatase [Candidatus Binataceae bacterium]|nr:ferrochelatase [Candidatus Binataceae bacterium]
MSERGIDAVLLIGFGGPTRREEIRPFLDNVLRGRPVPKERYEEVVRHYEAMGGRSPYNEHTMRQADALRMRLSRDRIEIPVVVGMRNSQPYLPDAMRELARMRTRRALGFILAAHRSEASFERYQAAIEEARTNQGSDAPAVEYPAPWHTDARFIEAVVARVSEALARFDAADRERAQLIFTAHSIPVAMSEASSYAKQVKESARLVAAKLGRESWSLAFQSRSGSPREAWLEPDIADALRRLAAGSAAAVVPIGFLCDHIEVLYDLDIAAAAVARETGIKMVRAGTVGDHPAFIEMMAAIVRAHLGS